MKLSEKEKLIQKLKGAVVTLSEFAKLAGKSNKNALSERIQKEADAVNFAMTIIDETVTPKEHEEQY